MSGQKGESGHVTGLRPPLRGPPRLCFLSSNAFRLAHAACGRVAEATHAHAHSFTRLRHDASTALFRM
eukprot:7376019-Prymnesium_polylepis.2